ncbi:hypothetical protein [Paenibacillus sp. GCM10028914]|uniref:hypothetical protein n=1 Tax=Paenibacillus sp. GCM10028914 TaxID=3273416 RepID=UPI00360DEE6B
MKSPGGSIFPYYYKGGEIHCLKYGNKYKNKEALFHLMKQEEEFITATNRRLKIWVDFYKTSISDSVLIAFVENIKRLNNHIHKISIVGLSGINIWRLKRKIRKSNLILNLSFYADPEEAKSWLVSER